MQYDMQRDKIHTTHSERNLGFPAKENSLEDEVTALLGDPLGTWVPF